MFVTGKASSLYVAECWYIGGDLYCKSLQVLRAVQTGQFVGQQKFCRPIWRADILVLTVAYFLIACSRRPMFSCCRQKLMSGWFVGQQSAGQCEQRINSYVLQQQNPEWSDILEPAYLARAQDCSLMDQDRSKDQRPRAAVRFLGRQQPPPHQARESGERRQLHQRVRAEPRPPKGFPLFSALRMASPDTIILLIVDYHAAIGGRPPRSPCVRPCGLLRLYYKLVVKTRVVLSFLHDALTTHTVTAGLGRAVLHLHGL